MRWGHQVGWGPFSVQCLPSLIFPFPFPFPPSAQILRNQVHGLFFEFTSTAACHERSSLGAKRYEATSSRSDGKLKSIAENRSGVEVNLQQGEDHRRPWSKAQLRFRGQSLSNLRSSLGAKRYEATSSRVDGKLKSIAENRSGVEVNLQQGEDHRRPWSKAQLKFRSQSLSNFRLLAWR